MRRLCEFDVFVPLVMVGGRRWPAKMLRHYKAVLVREFGGITDFRHRSRGEWRYGDVVYRDDIWLLRVLSDDRRHAHRVLRALQRQLQRELKQKDVLIIERQVRAL